MQHATSRPVKSSTGQLSLAAERPQCSDFSPITSTPYGGLSDHITALSFDKNKHLGKGVWLSRVRTVLCFAPHVFCDLVSPSCWLLIWSQVCLVISPLIVCVFKVKSIQFAFVGLWVYTLPVLPWCVTLLLIKNSSIVNSSSPRSWLPCSCVKRDNSYVYMDTFCFHPNEFILIVKSERSVYMNAK